MTVTLLAGGQEWTLLEEPDTGRGIWVDQHGGQAPPEMQAHLDAFLCQNMTEEE